MSDKKLASSKYTFTVNALFLLTPVLLCLELLLFYLVFKGDKLSGFYIFIACHLLVINALFLYKILKLKQIEVYKHYFTVRKIFIPTPKKIFKSDILHYAEQLNITKFRVYRTIRFYLNGTHIDISEAEYENYTKIKSNLIRGISCTTKLPVKKYNWNRFIISTSLLIFVVAIVWIGFIAIININDYTKKSTSLEYYIIIPILITLICLIGIYYTWKDYKAK